MAGRQKARSEETRQAILTAAGKLFADRGYDAVTMREIATAAGCSHTAIYIYFTDKEALLHQLAMGPLQSLQQQMESTLLDPALPPDDRLRHLSRTFIHFCLENRHMYTVLFKAKASRVDEEAPDLEVQQLRNHLFDLLRRALQACLSPAITDGQVLAYARIFFFTVHGILDLYAGSPEPFHLLMDRLAPTFDLSVDVMLIGIKQTAERSVPLQ